MSIRIEDLRYVRLGSADPGGAAAATMDLLGMGEAWRDGDAVALRGDHREFSLLFERGHPSLQSIGLEVRDADALERAAELLQAGGIAWRRDDALAAKLHAKALLAFTTPGGLGVELVLRPMDKGWRFHAGRDSGLRGLSGVAIRTPEAARDQALWTGMFGMRVADWIGDAACLGFDRRHHRLSLHPAASGGLVSVEFELESCDKVMQLAYFAQERGIAVRHGPGRRPASGQVFLSVDGPEGACWTLVAEGDEPGADARPRQFAAEPSSYCAWGSPCDIPEYISQSAAPPRAPLRGVGAP